jgi:hypothetical protein
MIAAGRGRIPPRSARLWVKRFDSTMFIGEPCPIKRTGIFSVVREQSLFFIKNILSEREVTRYFIVFEKDAPYRA